MDTHLCIHKTNMPNAIHTPVDIEGKSGNPTGITPLSPFTFLVPLCSFLAGNLTLSRYGNNGSLLVASIVTPKPV